MNIIAVVVNKAVLKWFFVFIKVMINYYSNKIEFVDYLIIYRKYCQKYALNEFIANYSILSGIGGNRRLLQRGARWNDATFVNPIFCHFISKLLVITLLSLTLIRQCWKSKRMNLLSSSYLFHHAPTFFFGKVVSQHRKIEGLNSTKSLQEYAFQELNLQNI